MENILDENDDVYVLGDFFLGTDYDAISQILKDLPGKIHLIIDSHDTDKNWNFTVDVQILQKLLWQKD